MKKNNIKVIIVIGVLSIVLIGLIVGVLSLKREKLEITDETVENGIFQDYYNIYQHYS